VPRQERPGQGRICIEHFCGKIQASLNRILAKSKYN
jgi:hypothetical protein